MMRMVLGYQAKSYLIQLNYFAKRLGATAMIVNRDGSVDLFCEEGCICLNYRPTKKDLYRRDDKGSYDPRYDVEYIDEEV